MRESATSSLVETSGETPAGARIARLSGAIGIEIRPNAVMFCVTPSSAIWKSSCLRSTTSRPSRSRTITGISTSSTPERNCVRGCWPLAAAPIATAAQSRRAAKRVRIVSRGVMVLCDPIVVGVSARGGRRAAEAAEGTEGTEGTGQDQHGDTEARGWQGCSAQRDGRAALRAVWVRRGASTQATLALFSCGLCWRPSSDPPRRPQAGARPSC